MISDAATGSFEFDAFISYRSTDANAAMEIVNDLESKGVKCWIAPRNIRPGVEYGDEIISGIKRSKTLVVVISSSSIVSRHVRAEVERAINLGHRVFPVRIENVDIGQSLEFFLSSVQWIDIFDDLDGYQIEKLVSTILTTSSPTETKSEKKWLPRWAKWILPSFMAGFSVFLLSFLFNYFYQIVYKNNIENALEEQQEVIQKVVEEKQKELIPDISNIKVDVKKYQGYYTVGIDQRSIGSNIYAVNSYFLIDGVRKSSGALFFKTDGEFREVMFGIETNDHEPIEEIDITKLIRNEINATIENLVRKTVSNIECSIGGCYLGYKSSQLVCESQSAVIYARSSEEAEWNVLPNICGDYKYRQKLCYSYRDLNFSPSPNQRVEFSIQIENQIPIHTQVSLEAESLKYLVRGKEPSFDNWVVLKPIKEKNSDSLVPTALLAYQPSSTTVSGFKLKSGIEGCHYGGRSRVALNGWLVDTDGQGLVRVGNDLDLVKRPSRLDDSDLLRLSNKSQHIAIAADLEDGSREGPFWYRLDLLKAIELAAPLISPELVCKKWGFNRRSDPYVCKPRHALGWMKVEKVEIGRLQDELTKVFTFNISTLDFIKSSCAARGGIDCDLFSFEVPRDWKNVYFRITTKDHGASNIERVLISK